MLRQSAIALLILTATFAQAVEIRVATFNLELGLEAVGTPGHDAVRDVLARIDPDVVTMQEVRTADLSGSPSHLDNLAGALGYPHIFIPGSSPLDGGNRNVFLSRFPYSDTADVAPPAGANDMTRRHAVVTVDVPGTSQDPTLASVHLKCCLDPDDSFRRAVELKRLVDHLAGFTGTDNLIVLGDFNLIGSNQTYNSLPAGLPASYVLGADVTFPVDYFNDPADYFTPIPLIRLVSYHQNGTSTATNGSSVLDHILVTPSLTARPHATEVYNSNHEASFPGLPKSGSPLPASTSGIASDHYPVFGDFDLDDDAPLTLGVSPGSVSESDPAGSAVLTVTLPAAPGAGESVTVDLSSNDPGEAQPAQSSLLFGTGVSSINVDVLPQTDGIPDPDRLVTFTATATGYASDTAELTVINVDSPFYQLTATGVAAGEDFSGFDGTADPPRWTGDGGTWLGADDGTSAASGLHAYGAPSDPSLGILPGSTARSFEAQFENQTGTVVTALQISCSAEQWRGSLGGAADTWSAELVVGGPPVALTNLDFTAATNLPDGPVAGGNPTALSTIVSGLSLAPAETVTLRFTATPGPGAGGLPPSDVFINEFHYNNEGGDVGEFVEVVVGPGFSDPLSTLSIVLYNGNGGGTYGSTHALDSFSPGTTTTSGHRILSKDIPGIQNGSPDGIAVVHSGTVLHFISYQGALTASDGPAMGMLSTDIGVDQDPAPPIGSGSLGLTGSGGSAADFSWIKFSGAYSKGAPNESQTFTAPAGHQGIAIDDVFVTALLDTDGDGDPDLSDPDDDNDGLTDSDEATLGTDPLLADSDSNGTDDGDEDADSDGQSNAAELNIVLTNPLDPLSRFQPTIAEPAVANPSVSFPTLTGRTYRIERCADLDSWSTLSIHPGTGATLDIPVAAAPGSQRSFYRVVVTLIP